MLSEYEQNLIKEIEGPVPGRKSRKWSLVRQPSSVLQGNTYYLFNISYMIYINDRPGKN